MKLRELTRFVLLLALPLLALLLAVGGTNAMTAMSANADAPAMTIGKPDGAFERSDMSFESKLLPSDGVAGEKLGNSVSLGENIALISGSERAYVYRWNGVNWVEEQKLTASDGSAGQRFGLSVSVYGEVAIVGSDYDNDNGEKSGSAYVFRWNGSSWIEEAKLSPSDATAGDGFGFDVALHGNVALVGAYGNQSHTGSAYVFRWNGTSWVEEAKLIANDRTQGDQFAYSLSVHEDVILIGARYDDHTAQLSGSAYVYRWDGTNWNQEAKLRPTDGNFQSNFGSSVSIEGDVALIGAELHDKLGFGAGAAYVYRWNGSEWTQEAQLLASDGDRTDQYGRSVSLDGNLALVGAIGNEDNGGHSGSAYVYEYNGSTWPEVLKLNASDGATTDLFGHSVSFRDDLALISAWQDDDNGEDSGSAYVYDLSFVVSNPEITLSPASFSVILNEGQSSSETLVISNTGNINLDWQVRGSAAWLNVTPTSGTVVPDNSAAVTVDVDASGLSAGTYTDRLTITSNDADEPSVKVPISLVVGSPNILETKLLVSDGAAGQRFGRSVSIDGDVALVGAYWDDDNGAESGSAHIYRLHGSQWQEESKLLPSDGAGYDWFARAVSIDGDVALVGAMANDDNGINSGSAYIYRWDGSQWQEESKLLPTDGSSDDQFGNSVSINGDVALVGAALNDDHGNASGSAYIYRWDGSQWQEESKLLPSDGAEDDWFGNSVSINGDVALVGAALNDDNGTNSGSVYIYRWDGSQWQEESKLLPSDGTSEDQFGHSVSIDGNVAIVGANRDDDNGYRSGSAYIYRWDGSQWQEESKLLAGDVDDRIGHSVSIDGNIALVGTYRDADNGPLSGAVYIYRWNGSQWNLISKRLASDGAEYDRFAWSVSIDGNRMIVGAYRDDDNGEDSGSAYVYDLSSGASAPDIAVSPDSFSVTLTEGQSSSETLVIHNTGTNDLDWQVSSNTTWLTASSTSGTITANGSQSLTININTALLTAGSHSGTVTITSNDPDEPTILVPVTLTVNSPLQLGKTVSAATARPGDALTYTIVVTATEYTSNIRLIDQLPIGLSYVASTATGGATYEENSRQIHYAGSVTPDTPLVITYQATVDSNMQPGTILYNAAELISGNTRLDAAAAVGIPDNNVNQTLVLLYVNGDNDLSKYMPNLVNRAEQGAGNEHLTVLLLLDGPDKGDTYLYRLEEDDDPSCPSYSNPTCDGRYVLGQNLWQWGENIANPYSLHDFLIGAQRAYPQANQIILSLVGHGGGWAPTTPGAQPGKRHGVKPGGLLWDDHVESSLSTAELGQALTWFQQKTGRKIDLLYLDACLMAMSEVAYEVRESVDYLLASQSWSWTSFSYDAHLNAINESTTAREIGEAWLANEASVLRPDEYPFTYSLINLSQMTALREAQNSLANALSATLPDDKEKINEAFRNSACFDSDNNGSIVQTGSTELDDYCDLYSFSQQIETQFNEQGAVLNAAQEVQNAITAAVVAKDHHNGIAWEYSNEEWAWEELGGLSIYLPLIEDKWGRGFYNARHLQIAKDGQWDEFLTNAYWNNAQPPNAPECANGDCEPPGPWRIAQISLQASGGQDSINVNWNLQSSLTDTDRLDHYQLYRAVNGNDYEIITSDIDSQYTDDNLTPRSEYCYYVQALDRNDKLIGLSNVACVEFGTLELWIPNEVVSPNDTNVLIPINLENGNGLCIGAMEVVISYDPTIARPTGEVKSTIYSQGYEFELIDTQQPGTIKIELSTTQCQALRGAGQLFTVGFDIIGSEGKVSTLGFIGGLNGTVIYNDDDLYTPLDLALQHGSLKVGSTFIRGDINGDGVVNVADPAFSGRIANHKITPTVQQVMACDINGDQACTSADTTLIKCYRRNGDWNQCGGSQSRSLVAREYNPQDGPAKVVMGAIENSQSGRIRVPVRLTNAQNFAGGDFTFSYNAGQMSATGATLTSLTEAFQLETNLAQPGLLHLSLASEDPIEADGTILMLEFRMTNERSNRLLSDDGSSFNIGTVRLNDTTGRDFKTSALQQDIEGSFCLADLNDDNKIDIVDVQTVSSRWNTEVGDSQYDPLYDLEGDGEIDIFDVQYISARWNTTCQTTQ